MGYDRRLPVYLLLDCSESMAGEPIKALDNGLRFLLAELRGNPMALETVALSIIGFSSKARQLVPLTDLIGFQVPKLRLGSGTALGAALDLWQQCMAREVIKSTPDQKGDYKPICFLLTDGEPTDSWERAADQVRTAFVDRNGTLVAVACGADADPSKLRRLTETVVTVKDSAGEALAGFFKWVSASVSTASQKLEAVSEAGVRLPDLPGEQLAVAPVGQDGVPPDPERFVFLHARCTTKRNFYLMRFKKSARLRRAAAHQRLRTRAWLPTRSMISRKKKAGQP